MLAVAVPGGLVRLFIETISGDELEKLLKDAIVKHCRFSYAQIKDFRYLQYNAGSGIINQLRHFYRTVVG